MKYEVLARRYRPRRFEEVVGQESAAETLRGAIVQGRVAHAYLFAGPRGVGKTSMARIFAKALNCQKASGYSPSDPDWAEKIAALPCNECSTCDGIHIGQDIDVVEMDGASHRGIEDVRSIVESVNRPATRSTYKIYIIDEVHMLTREAFNALLKTLEEPPAHVKFIFATTEAHRIPDTVLSRCQRFDFHPIGEQAIALRLEQILSAEDREAEEGLLDKIARYGRGGLRDAQTLLDQMLTFSEGELRAGDLERITGRMPTEVVRSLCEAVVDGDDRAVLAGLQTCSEKGADPAVLLEQVIEFLREEVHRIVASDPGAGDGESAPERAPLDRLLGALQILLEAASKLRHSALPVIAVEVVLLKVARLEDPLVLEEVLRKLTALSGEGASHPTDHPESTHAGTGPGRPARDRRRPPGNSAGPPERPATAGPARPPTPQPATRSAGPDRRPAHHDDTSTSRPPLASRPASGPEISRPASPEPVVDESRGSAVSSTAEMPPPDGSQELSGDAPNGSRGSASVERAELSLDRLLSLWNQIGIELQEKEPHIAPLVGDMKPTLHPERKDTARLFFDDDFFLARMKSPQTRRAFENLVADVTGQPWKFDLTRNTDRSKQNGGTAAASNRTARAAPPRGEGSASGRPVPGGSAPPAPPGAASSLAGSEVVEKARKLFNGRIV